MGRKDIDWDKVISIEMLCKCGHVNIFTVNGECCEICGLKLEHQFAFSEDSEVKI